MSALTQDTKITIGTAVACMSIAIAGTWRFSEALKDIEMKVDHLARDAYPLTAACEQALRMAIENPGFRVPDPRDPNKIIVVLSK